jgi:hypothetical protein
VNEWTIERLEDSTSEEGIQERAKRSKDRGSETARYTYKTRQPPAESITVLDRPLTPPPSHNQLACRGKLILIVRAGSEPRLACVMIRSADEKMLQRTRFVSHVSNKRGEQDSLHSSKSSSSSLCIPGLYNVVTLPSPPQPPPRPLPFLLVSLSTSA